MATSVYPLTVFYDRSCPLCREEMHFLATRAGPERIHLVDASAPDFINDTGISTEALMARIYGRQNDGTLLSGMALLRAVYTAAGLGRVLRATGWPILKPLFDGLYRIVARYRYYLPAWAVHRLFPNTDCRDGICTR